MKRTIIIISSIIFSATLLLSCFFNNDEKEKVVMNITYNLLKTMHYKEITFNDKLSNKIFDKYIENLDHSKRFLLKSDIRKLNRYRDKLDNQIRETDLSFFEISYEIIKERQKDVKEIYKEILEEPFELNSDEKIDINAENTDFAKNKNELKQYWRKFLKLEVLQEIDNKLNQYENNKSDTLEQKSLEELEIEARKNIRRNYEDYFNRLSKLRREDFFSLYLNAIALSTDPHSQYFAPKSKEDFDIHISGELEGIGATLTQRFGEIKVTKVVVGGAAWKQGELEEGDIILKVAQEGEDPVTITNMRLDDAVRLIRGKKGTNVYLTVRKIDGTIKEIKIERDKIILEETYIRSIILKDSSGNNVGYINLPSFYIDFQHHNGRRCSRDFKDELMKLKKENVKGIIIDLRSNGGGSLSEVVKIAGYFIKKGPIVQVRARNGRIKQLDDNDASVLYEDNVLIMTNHFSASASEIFAAAMQDYNRALIFGTPQTLGKGTVQQMLDLDKATRVSSKLKPLGALKLTIQKFYRINGGSTQLKGVNPDISYVSNYTYLDMKESAYDNVLPWDKIRSLKYKKWQPNYNIETLRKWSKKRMNNDSAFIATKNYALFLKEEDEKEVFPLNLEKYRKDKKNKKEKRKKYNKLTRKKIGLSISYLNDDINSMKTDTLMKYRYDNWSKKLKKDFKLQEAFNIVLDMNKF